MEVFAFVLSVPNWEGPVRAESRAATQLSRTRGPFRRPERKYAGAVPPLTWNVFGPYGPPYDRQPVRPQTVAGSVRLNANPPEAFVVTWPIEEKQVSVVPNAEVWLVS
jgi:hypothetical protein